MTANNIWQWFQENEASTGGVTDKIQNYLTAAGYTGATNEALYRWLGARGYEGSLADRIYQFEYFNTFRYIDISAKLVLEKFGTDAHVWIPGIGYFNGLQAGNYIDSAGTQAGLVDNPVGLVMDAEGSLGAELVTNGDFSNGTTGWTSTGSATVANLSGELEVTGSASTDRAIQIVNLTAGKTYFVSGYARAGTSTARSIIFYSSGFTNNLTFNLVSGNVSGYFTPSVTGAGQIWLRVDVGTAYFDNISVREVTGAITAAQGTTANKPILRRGAVNLLLRSEEFDISPWAVSGLTVTANQTAAPNGTLTGDYLNATAQFQFIRQSPGTTLANTAYVFSVYVKQISGDNRITLSLGNITSTNVARNTFVLVGDGSYQTAATSGTATAISSSITSVGNGWYRCSFVATVDTTSLWAYISAPSTTSSVYAVWGAQLELGSTASEYIPTTTAAASSSSGNYYWQFDGSNDSLALSSVPFQMADDHCVVAGVRQGTNNATIWSITSSTTDTPYVARIRQNLANSITTDWGDNASLNVIHSTSLNNGVLGVISARNVAGTRIGRLNGTQFGTSSTSLGATTVNTATIGARIAATTSFTNAAIFPVIAIKGTVSDADLLVLERWVGSLSGVSI